MFKIHNYYNVTKYFKWGREERIKGIEDIGKREKNRQRSYSTGQHKAPPAEVRTGHQEKDRCCVGGQTLEQASW